MPGRAARSLWKLAWGWLRHTDLGKVENTVVQPAASTQGRGDGVSDV